ncbi:N-acetyltransferase [Campylobacter sp. MIT 12-5580]|uniref:GNAT family N-acetyltransferase n=1 Tax=Campylobacter sp. MIT 12-5580 TaxID=2040651 RepID=UPI0010F6B2D3|nr:GNAT family N-acetyltransferase [Campylobacter sp. MIT 12-5580]TKX30215.1 N-acetyltransferase [Campylobacter sp. MIT 12-5580]
MNSFENFLKAYEKGFKLQNYYEGMQSLKEKLLSSKLTLKQIEHNFFFYEKNSKLLHFFISHTHKDFKLKNSIIKLIYKRQKELLNFKDFLEYNHFQGFESFVQMRLKNETLKPINFDFVEFARLEDLHDLKDFFTSYFDEQFLFVYDEADLQAKIRKKEILCVKELGKIKAALSFSVQLGCANLDFIASSIKQEHKNAGYALLNHFFILNQKAYFFKLFVNENNEKAINFYQRAGFVQDMVKLEFYRNFN